MCISLSARMVNAKRVLLLCFWLIATCVLYVNGDHYGSGGFLLPTKPPSVPTYCYKKSYGEDEPTMCKAKSFGCYETERSNGWDSSNALFETKIRMGCLNKPCKPLSRYAVKRQCCNTSLCNDLHQNRSLFQPTLPPVDPNQHSYHWMYCYCDSCANKSCISFTGCYTVYQTQYLDARYTNRTTKTSGTVIERTCINDKYISLCYLRNPGVIDQNGRRGDCCYSGNYCNRPPTPLPPWAVSYWENRSRSSALSATPPIVPDNATSVLPLTTSASSTTYHTPPTQGYTIYYYIAGGTALLLLIVMVIIVVTILACCLWMSGSKGENELPAAPPVRGVRVINMPPPLPADNESMTLTVPVEEIR